MQLASLIIQVVTLMLVMLLAYSAVTFKPQSHPTHRTDLCIMLMQPTGDTSDC